MRGLTEHEAQLLRRAAALVGSPVPAPGTEADTLPADWPVLAGLRARGCLAVVAEQDGYDWLQITPLGRIALRVHRLSMPPIVGGSSCQETQS